VIVSGCSHEKCDSFNGHVCWFCPGGAYGLSGDVELSVDTDAGSVVAVSCQI
jgi:hypothetical protein